MVSSILKGQRITAMPLNAEVGAVYFLKVGGGFKIFVVGSDGTLQPHVETPRESVYSAAGGSIAMTTAFVLVAAVSFTPARPNTLITAAFNGSMNRAAANEIVADLRMFDTVTSTVIAAQGFGNTGTIGGLGYELAASNSFAINYLTVGRVYTAQFWLRKANNSNVINVFNTRISGVVV